MTKTSGRLQEDFRMTQSTQRALSKHSESNQTLSYCQSLKYFVLFFLKGRMEPKSPGTLISNYILAF